MRFFSISRMSSARTDVVMAQTQHKAQDVGDARLGELAFEARLRAKHTGEIEAMHRAQTLARGEGAAKASDKQMDAAVVGIFDGVEDERDYLVKAGDPRAAVYDDFLTRHFKGQVSTVTRAPYEEELQRVERLYAEATGAFAPYAAAASLTKWVDRIGEHIGPYRAALDARDRVTRGDLESARREMHLHTCAVVGHICSAYIGQWDVVDALLAPLVDQQDRIAAIMRARRQGVQTGAVDGDLDGLIEGDGEAPQPSPDADAEAGADDAGAGAAQPAADARPADARPADAQPADAQPAPESPGDA